MLSVLLGTVLSLIAIASTAYAQYIPAPTPYREISCEESRLSISTPDRVVCQRREFFTERQTPLPRFNSYVRADGKHFSVMVETPTPNTSGWLSNVQEAQRLSRLKAFNEVTQAGRDWSEFQAGPSGSQIARFTAGNGRQCFTLFKSGPPFLQGFQWLMWGSACEPLGSELTPDRIDAFYRSIQFK
jgi:hypothetical protein